MRKVFSTSPVPDPWSGGATTAGHIMEAGMRGVMRTLVVVALVLLVPAALYAQQATIAGVVKDASGAVLPGVSVEAASPALTEKVRSVVTDGTGQYRIVVAPAGHLRRHGDAAGIQHRQA